MLGCFNPRPRTGGDIGTTRKKGDHQGFNPRPRTGGDPPLTVKCTARQEFQSAPPHGGRPAPDARGLSGPMGFNPRPRTGGDQLLRHLGEPSGEFQSAPPHGGRLCFLNHHVVVLGSFNPRPRTGGDSLSVIPTTRPTVSIRAPARGATRYLSFRPPDQLFQSAPPHGGRLLGGSCERPGQTCFNPRPRTGGDSSAAPASAQVKRVSIRAPARGATPRRLLRAPRSNVFQSAPPHGGRRGDASMVWCRPNSFQSAPPHGGRPPVRSIEMPVPVSIRAPARGATLEHGVFALQFMVSIRAPARGATK